MESSMASLNTRRWPRYHVHLPVFISNETEVSTVAVPGLVSEISLGGMELYGGVERRLGDLMEVEFQSAGPLRLAAVVRSRSGFCFGVEFLSLMPSEPVVLAVPEHKREDWRLGLGQIEGGKLARGTQGSVQRTDANLGHRHLQNETESDDAVFVEIFLDRHETFLRQAQMEIQNLRQRARKIRQWREEVDVLLRKGFGPPVVHRLKE
jgi:hypothetical protein